MPNMGRKFSFWLAFGGLSGFGAIFGWAIEHNADRGKPGFAVALKRPDLQEARQQVEHRQRPQPVAFGMLAPASREKLDDAARWGVRIPSDAFNAIEGSAYYYEHGRIDSTGLPLAGGGIVGRDDWRTINMNGQPTQSQIAVGLRRARLFQSDMQTKNPVKDADQAASNGNWKLFIVPIEKMYFYVGETRRSSIKFLAIGLEKELGCQLTETMMRENGKRTLNDYYDDQSFYAPSIHHSTIKGSAVQISSLIKNLDEKGKYNIIDRYESIYNKRIFKLFNNHHKSNVKIINGYGEIKSHQENIAVCHAELGK